MTEPPIIVAIDGFLAPKLRRIDIGRDLAALGVLVLASLFGWNGWPKALDWWIDRQVAKLVPAGRTFVALGFSAGAPAAARLAERNPNCVGLVYISGKYKTAECQPPGRFHGFPALFLTTDDELDELVDGTYWTYRNYAAAGADARHTAAPNPGTHKRPHLAGVAHHLPAIRAFMDKHFGGIE